MNLKQPNESSETALSLFFLFSDPSLIVLVNPMSRLIVGSNKILPEICIEIQSMQNVDLVMDQFVFSFVLGWPLCFSSICPQNIQQCRKNNDAKQLLLTRLNPEVNACLLVSLEDTSGVKSVVEYFSECSRS